MERWGGGTLAALKTESTEPTQKKKKKKKKPHKTSKQPPPNHLRSGENSGWKKLQQGSSGNLGLWGAPGSVHRSVVKGRSRGWKTKKERKGSLISSTGKKPKSQSSGRSGIIGGNPEGSRRGNLQLDGGGEPVSGQPGKIFKESWKKGFRKRGG